MKTRIDIEVLRVRTFDALRWMMQILPPGRSHLESSICHLTAAFGADNNSRAAKTADTYSRVIGARLEVKSDSGTAKSAERGVRRSWFRLVRGASGSSEIGAMILPDATVSRTLRAEAIESSERGDSLARRRYQQGHIFLIGSTWYGKYREDIEGEDGNTRRKQVTVTLGSTKDIPTKPLAKRRMEIILARINSPDYRPGRFAKMNEFATLWQQHVLVGNKPSTVRSAKSHLAVHILPHFGKRGLDEIGVQAQQFFVTKLVQANVSRKTLLNILSTLSSILDTAKSWGYVCQSVDYKSLTFPVAEVEPEARFFSLEEVGKIIAVAREPYKTMFMLLALTGMRAGEMLGLQWGDIDFEKGLLSVRRSAWYGRVQTTKNKNSEAIIPLPTALAGTLSAYRERWKSNPDGFLFVTRNRRPPSSNKVVEYGLWPVLDLLGIRRCGLHAFRQTHTSLLLDTGATPKVVQEQLRHADPRVTLGVYAHVLGEAHREAVEKVASLVLQSVPKVREENECIQ